MPPSLILPPTTLFTASRLDRATHLSDPIAPFQREMDSRSSNTGSVPTTTIEITSKVDSLPEMPTWLIHVIIGTWTFILIVAVVLYCNQCWPSAARWRWLLPSCREITRNGNAYDAEVLCEDCERVKREADLEDVGADEDCDKGESRTGGREASRGLKRRATKNLRIRTGARYAGLGIAVAGSEPNLLPGGNTAAHQSRNGAACTESLWDHARKRLSKNTMGSPLLSLGRMSSPKSHRDDMDDLRMRLLPRLEAGFGGPKTSDPHFSSPLSCDVCGKAGAEGLEQRQDAGRYGLRQRIKDSIYKLTDCASRAFHDPVTGHAEDGLLLPVKEYEREINHPPSIFVEGSVREDVAQWVEESARI